MIIIKIYDSETENTSDDDIVYSIQIQDGEFVQSELSVDADIDAIGDAIEIASDEFSAAVIDEFSEESALH